MPNLDSGLTHTHTHTHTHSGSLHQRLQFADRRQASPPTVLKGPISRVPPFHFCGCNQLCTEKPEPQLDNCRHNRPREASLLQILYLPLIALAAKWECVAGAFLKKKKKLGPVSSPRREWARGRERR
uniref:Uncharacterized protein n=1 Tax=Pipistrellus kuhlii TaxID=59472 RepID=A0A7J7SFB1_PIPKU|nr:hypothetical protein mPipKuh1_009982 [Pipistrellus kuhlii]